MMNCRCFATCYFFGCAYYLNMLRMPAEPWGPQVWAAAAASNLVGSLLGPGPVGSVISFLMSLVRVLLLRPAGRRRN